MELRNDESQLPDPRALFKEFGIPDSNEIFALAHISGEPELQAQVVQQMFHRPEVSMAKNILSALADFTRVPQAELFARNQSLYEGVLKNPREISRGSTIGKIRDLFGQLGLAKIFGGSLSKREALIIQTKFLADIACGGFPKVECEPADELNFLPIPTHGATPESLMTFAIRMAYEARDAGESVDDLVEILREIKNDIFIGHLLAKVRILALRFVTHMTDGNGREFVDLCREQVGEWLLKLSARFEAKDTQRVAEVALVAREAEAIFAKLERILMHKVDGGGEVQ